MAGYAHSHSSVPPRRNPSPLAHHTHIQWPNGPCGWRDLSLGRDSQTCGCRSFWLRHAPQQDAAPSMESAFCFCGHHACYHDSTPLPTQEMYHTQTPFARPISQQSYLPAGPHPPHSFKTPSRHPQYSAPGLGLYTDDGQANQRTSPFARIKQSQERLNHSRSPQPDIASQAPTDVASLAGEAPHASPSRAFSQYVAQQRLLAAAPHIETAHLPRPCVADDPAQSATEVATPSQAGTPEFGRADAVLANVRGCVDDLSKRFIEAHANQQDHSILANKHAYQDALRNLEPFKDCAQEDIDQQMPLVEKLISHVQELKHIMTQRPGLWSSISDLDKRMDALETMSFSHNSTAELGEQFEAIDTRLLEMEGKVDELEKFRTAKENEDHEAARQAASRLRELESFEGSFCEDDTGAARRSGVSPAQRLKELERRLVSLEHTGSPSPQYPWSMEVVFLPWGTSLHGIWHEGDEASQASRSTSQESARNLSKSQFSSPISKKGANVPSHSASGSDSGLEWAGDDGDLLRARACAATSGTGGKIYERLRSRGFVRSLPIVSKDSRLIHASICDTFGDLLQLHAEHHDGALDRHLFGLQSPFVPLRKVHKSSRLRFLSAPELASPLLWTSDFLDSNVFMKQPSTGLRRLFITTPSAYLQHETCSGWSWQKLRELPRFDVTTDPSGQSFSSQKSQVFEADANEPCWMWDQRLDPPVSVTSSFTSNDSYQKHGSFHSHPLSPSVTHKTLASANQDGSSVADSESSDDEAPDEETSREHYIAPITPTSELAFTRGCMKRTVSMPLPSDGKGDHEALSRRGSSFQHASASDTTKTLVKAKRRRNSRSPDLPGPSSLQRVNNAVRGRWNVTPRRSHEPGSPSVDMFSDPVHQQTAAGAEAATKPGKRNPTPSAYATPFSGSVIPVEEMSWAGGDTDIDSSDKDSEYQDDGDDSDDVNESKEFDESDVVDEDYDHALMAEEEAMGGIAEGLEEDDDESEYDEMDESQ